MPHSFLSETKNEICHPLHMLFFVHGRDHMLFKNLSNFIIMFRVRYQSSTFWKLVSASSPSSAFTISLMWSIRPSSHVFRWLIFCDISQMKPWWKVPSWTTYDHEREQEREKKNRKGEEKEKEWENCAETMNKIEIKKR